MIFQFWLIFTVTFLVLLYSYLHRKANYWKARGVNGPKALPLIGSLWENLFVAQNVLEERRMLKYGRVYGTMNGVKPMITVGEPALLKQMMISDFRVFMNHLDFFENDPRLSRMLIELKDDEWKRVRSIISPAFTTGKLKAMQPLIEDCIRCSFDNLDQLEKQNKEVDLKNVALDFTLNVITKCVFGVEGNEPQNPNDEFFRNARSIVEIKVLRLLSKIIVPGRLQVKFGLQLVPKNLVNYFYKILTNIIEQRRETHTNRVDFVTLLLNAERKVDKSDSGAEYEEKSLRITDNDIIAQCLNFFVAGYETTSTFIHFTLYVLVMHPDVQKKVHEEIKGYFEFHEKVDFDSLNALPYLEAVSCESLRLFTPITIFEHTCRDDYHLGDILIEKGVTLNLPLYAMHHDPEFFAEPHKFIPERFLPENRDKIKEYSYIPFGLGPRNCIGMRFSQIQAKLFLAHFIKNFEVIKTKNTSEKVEFNGRYIFLTCKPLIAAIRRRRI